MKTVCAVVDCGRKKHANDLCQTHYDRRRKGEPDWDRPIRERNSPLTLRDRLLNARQFILIHPHLGPCWIRKGTKDILEYGTVAGKPNTGTHRAAYLEWVGDIKNDLWVLHTCDIPACFNPDHLYLGTVVENSKDISERGSRKGTNNPGAVLTEDQVLEIRKRVRVGETSKDLAARFNVSQPTIDWIRTGRGWKHLL